MNPRTLLVMCLGLLSFTLPSPANAQQPSRDFDAAVQRIAKELAEKASGKLQPDNKTLGVDEFVHIHDPRRTFRSLSEALTGALADTGVFDVLERSRIESVLKEQGGGLSAAFDENRAVQLGKLLGAHLMVFGTYSPNLLPPVVRIEARLVSVESGKIEASSSVKILRVQALALAGGLAVLLLIVLLMIATRPRRCPQCKTKVKRRYDFCPECGCSMKAAAPAQADPPGQSNG